MKKVLLMLLILFLPFIVYAETCDTDKVTIESITLKDKSDNVVENSDPIVRNKSVTVDASMLEVGDSIEYTMVVKNDSINDFELDKTSLNMSSNYIDYTFKTDDNSDIIKAKTSKTIYLNIEYKTQVPDEVFVEGAYSDDKTIVVNLSSEEEIENPKTGIVSPIFLITLILIFSLTVFIVLKNNRYARFMVLLLGLVSIVPISINALCKCDISIESKVEIKKAFTGVIYRGSGSELHDGDEIEQTKITCSGEENSVNNCYYTDEGNYEENLQGFYIRHDIVNNIITASYACDGTRCIKGGANTDYEANKEIFLEILGYGVEDGDRFYDSGSHSEIDRSGNVRISSYCGCCIVTSNGTSYCNGLSTMIC